MAPVLVIAAAALSRNPSVVPESATETHLRTKLKTGQTVSTFSVATSVGQPALARSTQPVVLEAFATPCPQCQREADAVDHLYTQFGKRINICAFSGSEIAEMDLLRRPRLT